MSSGSFVCADTTAEIGFGYTDELPAVVFDEGIRLSMNKEKYAGHFIRAALYYMSDDFDNAKNELKKTIALEPKHYVSYLLLGRLVGDTDFDAASDYYRIAIQYAPKKAIVYNVYAGALLLKEKNQMAVNVLEEGLRNIQDETLYYNQAIILGKINGGDPRILRDINKAIELGRKVEYYIFLGIYYSQRDNNKKARSAFLKATRVSPKNVLALMLLSSTYKKTQEYAEAIRLLKKALNINPDDKKVLDVLRQYEGEYESLKKGS